MMQQQQNFQDIQFQATEEYKILKKQFEEQYKPLKAPYDDETNKFIYSFDISQEKEIREFFVQYGFVVVKNVLTDDECKTNLEELWETLNEHSYTKAIDPEDEDTFEDVDKKCKEEGIIGGGYPVLQVQALKNRQNEKIFRAYQVATNNQFFIVGQERYGFMRPTINHPEWKTKQNWLHIDYNPLTGYTSNFGFSDSEHRRRASIQNPIKWQNAYFQGIVALEDCPIETGGLHIVPGFQHVTDLWGQLNYKYCQKVSESSLPYTCDFAENDPIRNDIQQIPIRKGCLAFWDGRMAHANFPNTGDKPRFVQYIKLNAVGPNILSNVEPYDFANLNIPKEFKPSELGKKLFGLEKWF